MAKKKELTSNELADRWDYHPAHIRRLRSQGRGPRYYKLGTHRNASVIYKMSDVLKYEKSHLDIEIAVNTADS